MTLPPGYGFRPVRDDDVPALTALCNEESQALIGVDVVSEQWFGLRLGAPNADREADFAVVVSDAGALCGYFGLECEPPYNEAFAIGFVGRAFHGRGLGAGILRESERRAWRRLERADPAARLLLHAGALAGEPLASALFEAHGYAEVRRFLRMRIAFATAPQPPSPPPGIEIRPFHAGRDERAVFDCHQEAFADHWGDEQETFETFRHYTFEATDFDPSLWLLAWSGEELAGYLGCSPASTETPAFGHVELLGVRRAHRRRGIGEALLRAAFAVLRARGKSGCDLGVDANSLTGATRMYERVGMTSEPRFAIWEKELRAAAADDGT